MSLTLNMVGGGGGGSLKATDALLRVQAPAGSTVTITKGTTTKSDLGHENADDNSVYDYYFIIHQSQFDSVNPWTVTATLGAQTKSDTVIIDAADEYDVILSYASYLFKSGEGFVTTYNTEAQAQATLTVTNEKVTVTRKQTYSYQTAISWGSAVDITNYSRLVMDAKVDGIYNTQQYSARLCVRTSQITDSGSSATEPIAGQFLTADGTRQLYILDISSITGTYYLGLGGAWIGEMYNMYID